MTVAVAWVRTIHNCEELIFVSDSRLSGDGRIFDGCPKILKLPRSDCAIAFTGYTGHAFPMMLQLSLAIDSYSPARRRSLSISTVKQHALKIFGSMADLIECSPKVSVKQDVDPDANFLFGGYCWVKKEFELWSIVFSEPENCFTAHPSKWVYYSEQAQKFLFSSSKAPRRLGSPSRIVFAGDQASKARSLLADRLSAQHPLGNTFQGLDWEPFEVVRDMLRDSNHSETIGGAPQIVKVYQYMQTAPIGVYWPDKKSGKVFLQGRPCLGYEQVETWILDPDSLVSDSPLFSRNDKDDAIAATDLLTSESPTIGGSKKTE